MAEDGTARTEMPEATQREVDQAVREAEAEDDADEILIPE